MQAINTRFVTQDSSYSWQIITIFLAIFFILFISVCLMCRFMKDKDRKGGKRGEERLVGRATSSQSDNYWDHKEVERYTRRNV